MATHMTREQAQAMLKVIGLEVPESELDDIVKRVDSLLGVMEEVEAKLGERLNEVDPIPPVFPREDF